MPSAAMLIQAGQAEDCAEEYELDVISSSWRGKEMVLRGEQQVH